MRFSTSFLDEIRDRVPISSVIGARVSWDRKKTNTQRGDFWACCPFHGENTPSFHCEDGKGRYHCFGCGVSGDHFRFLTELDGMPFPEAVSRIADMAGVPMPARDPEAEKREEARSSLSDVMSLATQYFEEKLQAADGAKARGYLRERGLSSATQAAFRIGYAPDSRNALKQYLADKGVHKDQIEACGLVVHGPDIAVSYDRFRDRIMFPIEDTRGRVIAFGGRALSPDVPAKYLNSPETDLFHKGNILYNLARARKTAGKDGSLIAVEGYMDVIALNQAGFENAVAPLGTALTENQLDLMWRVAGEPLLCFDGDTAGVRAAHRAADLALPALRPGKSVRFVLMSEGQDPDDLIKARGPEAFATLLDEARPLADMLWARETAGGVFDTPERRAELERRLRDLTSRIGDENVRRHYAQDMRERTAMFFGREPAAGRQTDGQGRAQTGGFRRPGAAGGRRAVTDSLARSAMVKSVGGQTPLRETALIVCAANHVALLEEQFDAFESLKLPPGELKRLHAAIMDAIATQDITEREALVEWLRQSGVGEEWDRAEQLVRAAKVWPALEDAALDDARDAFRQAIHLHRMAGALHKELKEAELALATDPTDENFEHLLDVQNQFRDAQAIEALIEGFGIQSGRPTRSF